MGGRRHRFERGGGRQIVGTFWFLWGGGRELSIRPGTRLCISIPLRPNWTLELLPKSLSVRVRLDAAVGVFASLLMQIN